MRSKKNPFLEDNDDLTYVPGKGFVSSDAEKDTLKQLRFVSNIISLFLLIYFFFRRFLSLPITYLAYYLGFNIMINRYTGMIAASAATHRFILFVTYAISALAVIGICKLFFSWDISERKRLRNFDRSIFALAIPITVGLGLLGSSLGLLTDRGMRSLGIIVYTPPAAVSSLTEIALLSMASSFVMGILHEYFFCGVLLPVLQRYGDGFAVTVCALLAAISSDNIVESLTIFFFTLSSAYFTIRSGSLVPAIVSRAILEFFFLLSRIIYGNLEESLCQVILLVICLILLTGAIIAYLTFIQKDPQAFCLRRFDYTLSNKRRLTTFCSSFFFLLLILRLVVKVLSTVQYIG